LKELESLTTFGKQTLDPEDDLYDDGTRATITTSTTTTGEGGGGGGSSVFRRSQLRIANAMMDMEGEERYQGKKVKRRGMEEEEEEEDDEDEGE